MAKEIERKFLVRGTDYKRIASGHRHIVQAYLSPDPDATVRVRVAGDEAFLTVKGRNAGCVRDEWEYPVPMADALAMIRLARLAPIEKTRWYVGFGGYTWEIDEFHGRLEGLTVAEVEMADAADRLPLPAFIGREVTDDKRYFNSVLARGSEIPPSA